MSFLWRSGEYSSFVQSAAARLTFLQLLQTRPVIAMMKSIPVCLLAAASFGTHAGQPAHRPITLSQDPLIMRLSKDEFRIAFGINAEQCSVNGCHGLIQYRVHWKTEDGATHSEIKQVSYEVPPHYGRSIAVDRQYFDTGEGQHTTEIVKVSVDAITCHEGSESL